VRDSAAAQLTGARMARRILEQLDRLTGAWPCTIDRDCMGREKNVCVIDYKMKMQR
jgi:hypothetical protein